MNYRGKFILFILAAMLLLAACGEADPTPTSVPEPTDTAVPPTATPKPTEEPTATSTPLSAGVPEPTDTPEAEPTEEPAAEMPDNLAPIVNDEGGVVSITGVVTYTNPFFTLGVAAPLVITEDQAGFVERDENYIFPVESQTLGQITSDFSESPFSYSLTLPIEPKGAYKDVDNDGEEDLGVQVFAIAYWNNTFGDPFLEERDLGGGGWSTAYASTRISDEVETEREIVGGKLLVYAPDDQQGFPGGFGEDGLLFTEDDPIVILPPGYTVVDLDSDPFTFDRAREQVIDLIEPEGAALVDYSELSYTEAFDALVDQLQNEYAFTEYKGIDWEALREEFRPEFEAADEAKDADRYLNALGRFALAIPDGHVSGPFLRDAFREAILGGIGLAVKELDDGRVLAVFLTEGGLAEQAGIEIGAEILEVNGAPISEHIGSVPLFQSFSADHARRLEQVTYAMRFPLDTEVELVYQNPGAAAAQTVRMTADFDPDSYNFWLEEDGRDGFELPVEFEVLDEGIGYVRIYSFSDNDLLTAQLWERMIQEMNDNDIPAIIVDMRQNGGGRGSLADNLAAYFFNEEFVLGNVAAYDKDRGEFYIDPDHEDKFILPPDEDLRYDGDVVVLVGPSCAS
ncbi:MAG TPA: peptidase S41, partial [Anaerolineae bacterium]|nr:peptidase S41 [Anaerolineae bacterium]